MFQLLAPHATPAAAKKSKAVAKKGDACALKLSCVTSVGAAIDSIGEGYASPCQTLLKRTNPLHNTLCPTSPDTTMQSPVGATS